MFEKAIDTPKGLPAPAEASSPNDAEPVYQKPRHARTLAQFFNVLLLLTVPANLACAVLSYGLATNGAILPELFSYFDAGSVAVYVWLVAGVALVSVLLTILTYMLSLDFRRTRRPWKRVHLLFASFFIYLAGAGLGALNVQPETWWAFVLASVAAAVAPLVVRLAERAMGKAFRTSAEGLLRAGVPAAARAAARTSLQFVPANPAAERAYGLAQASCGRPEIALPYLLRRPEEIPTLPPEVLAVLVDVYENAGEHEHSLTALETVYRIQPTPRIFEKLVRRWLSLGRKAEVLRELRSLPTQDQKPWYDTIRDLVFEQGDLEASRAFCQEVERCEGPPYTRAHTYYTQLLEKHPQDLSLHRALIELGQRRGDADHSAQLLEHILEMSDEGGIDDRRKLVSYYWTKGDRASMLRHLEHICRLGHATIDEKLRIIDERFSEGNYTQVVELVSGDPQLSCNVRALRTSAFALRNSGFLPEALEMIASCRSLSGSTPALDELEQEIRSQILAEEIATLREKLASAPENFQLRRNLYERLLESHADQEVVDGYRELLSQSPDLRGNVISAIEACLTKPGFHYKLSEYLGDLYLEDSRFDEAFSQYQKACRQDQGHLHLHTLSSRLLAQYPSHPGALEAETRYFSRIQDHGNVLRHLDRLRESGAAVSQDLLQAEFDAAVANGDLQRAETAGKAIQAQHPDDLALLTQLARISIELQHYEEATAYLEKAQSLDPENADYGALLRDVARRQKRSRVDELQALVESGATDSRIHEELGDLHQQLTEFSLAMTEYQRAITADPENRVSRAKLAYVLSRKGLHLDAHETLEETILASDLPAPELATLKELFYRCGEQMDDAGEYERALSTFRRIMRIEAGYRDVVDRVERLQGTVRRAYRDSLS